MEISKMDISKIYQSRRSKIYSFMKKNNLAAVVFCDSEDNRTPDVRYLCGHPNDALLVLTAEKKAYLFPWDINLAEKKAFADEVKPSTEFNRSNIECLKYVLSKPGFANKDCVELPPSLSFLKYTEIKNEMKKFKFICSSDLTHSYVHSMRAVKDEYEIECTRKACKVTDYMGQLIIKLLKQGKIKTEIDVALLIEKELRLNGCEKTSFDTLAAGPARSFAIHAFPGFTKNEWGTKGLSILDFGVCYEGYASDCTITIANKPNEMQKKMINLVETAASECLKLYKNGGKILAASKCAEKIFAQGNMKMPHGLGHGTGLEIHEAPFVNLRAEKLTFKAGNIVTLEPGLYDRLYGGVRLENDVLITKDGNEVLTSSKIVRL